MRSSIEYKFDCLLKSISSSLRRKPHVLRKDLYGFYIFIKNSVFLLSAKQTNTWGITYLLTLSCRKNSLSLIIQQFLSSFLRSLFSLFFFAAWKLFVFGVILVRNFLHLDRIHEEIRYFVSLRIQSECGKIRTRITPNTDTFYAVFPSTFA